MSIVQPALFRGGGSADRPGPSRHCDMPNRARANQQSVRRKGWMCILPNAAFLLGDWLSRGPERLSQNLEAHDVYVIDASCGVHWRCEQSVLANPVEHGSSFGFPLPIGQRPEQEVHYATNPHPLAARGRLRLRNCVCHLGYLRIWIMSQGAAVARNTTTAVPPDWLWKHAKGHDESLLVNAPGRVGPRTLTRSSNIGPLIQSDATRRFARAWL